MKAFIIINGKDVRIIEKENYSEAHTTAVNTCDHSREIILREIDLDNFKSYLNGRQL